MSNSTTNKTNARQPGYNTNTQDAIIIRIQSPSASWNFSSFLIHATSIQKHNIILINLRVTMCG